MLVKNTGLIPGYRLKFHGMVVFPQAKGISILCNASRKAVVVSSYLYNGNLGFFPRMQIDPA